MNLVKTPPAPIPLAAISAEAEEQRNALATLGLEIQSITCAGENSQARDVCVAIRNHLKSVEAARTELTKPLLDGQRMLKRLADDHVEPLKAELDRIERLATKFAMAEQERAEADAKARMDLAKEATTEADFAMVINEPVVAAQKAQGQQLRQKLCWEVVDIHALYKARPELVRLEANAAAIQACCVPEMPVPGLKLSWDTKTVFTTR